jgi:hypothetical protein
LLLKTTHEDGLDITCAEATLPAPKTNKAPITKPPIFVLNVIAYKTANKA